MSWDRTGLEAQISSPYNSSLVSSPGLTLFWPCTHNRKSWHQKSAKMSNHASLAQHDDFITSSNFQFGWTSVENLQPYPMAKGKMLECLKIFLLLFSLVLASLECYLSSPCPKEIKCASSLMRKNLGGVPTINWYALLSLQSRSQPVW